MGRRLDGLLGRGFRASKFKVLAKLAISRVLILKNQRQSRYLHAHSDVIQLLNLGYHERAFQRIEFVLEERIMLDAFVMIEDYCHLLMATTTLIQNNKECPGELKEAISSLVYASSRCGEFPELQEIREVFTSRFGEEFAARAVDLPNKCGVNPKMIQKLSTRQSSMENRLQLLKEIAYENGITLQLKEDVSVSDEEKLDVNQQQKQHESNELANHITKPDVEGYTNNLATTSQEAAESVGYATDAARVELSISEPEDNDADDHSDESSMPKIYVDAVVTLEEHTNNGSSFKIHPMENFGSESEAEEMAESSHIVETERSLSDSSSDSEVDALSKSKISNLNKPDVADDTNNLCEEIVRGELLSESKTEKYKDVATASQEASESAVAAVEISISELEDDDHSGFNGEEDSDESSMPEIYVDAVTTLEEIEYSSNGLSFKKIYPMENFGSGSEAEEMVESNQNAETEQTLSNSCLESEIDTLSKRKSSTNLQSDMNTNTIDS